MLDITTDGILDELAEKLWLRMVDAHASPIEFNLMAKLALEQRMLGGENAAFGLDKLNTAETATYIGLQEQTLHDKKKRRALGIPEPYSVGRKLFWRIHGADHALLNDNLAVLDMRLPHAARRCFGIWAISVGLLRHFSGRF